MIRSAFRFFKASAWIKAKLSPEPGHLFIRRSGPVRRVLRLEAQHPKKAAWAAARQG